MSQVMVARLMRGLVALCLYCACCLAAAADHLQNVHVFIVAIGEFEDSAAWRPLSAAASRAEELQQFFTDAYGLPHEQIHVYSNWNDNADESHLRRLPQDMGEIARKDNSIVFLFVLTHGEIIPTARLSEDLMIVASDTPGDGAQRPAERLIGSEIFRSLFKVGQGSVVFAFFDTCSSGAMAEIGQDILGPLSSYNFMRVVAAASSGPYQDSYNFSFTQTLVQRWRAPPDNQCVKAANLPDEIVLNGQRVEVVAGDNEICVNGIGKERAMLFVDPINAGPGLIKVFDPAGQELTPARPIQKSSSLPLLAVLPREKVYVELHEADGRILRWKAPVVDLAQTPMEFLNLVGPSRPKEPYGLQPRASGATTFGMQSPIAADRL